MFEITLTHYLIVALILFLMGLFGVIVSKNIIKILISIEFILNAVNINLVAFASFNDAVNVHGMVMSLFVIVIAAAEAAVGIALILAIFWHKHTVNSEKIGDLKG